MAVNPDSNSSILEPTQIKKRLGGDIELSLQSNTQDDSNIFKSRNYINPNIKFRDENNTNQVFTNSIEMDYSKFQTLTLDLKDPNVEKKLKTIEESPRNFEELSEEEEGIPWIYYLKIIVLITIIVLQVIVVIKYLKDITEMYQFVIRKGEELAEKDNFLTYFIQIFIEFVLALLCLPGKTGINMIEAFFIRNIFKMLLIVIIIPWLFGAVAYFIAYKILREWLLEKMIESPYYIIICKEVKKSPYQTVVLLFLQPHPPGFNSYILPLVGLKLRPFLLGTLPFYMFFGGQSILMGHQLDGLNNGLADEENKQIAKSWEELDSTDKCIKIISWFQLIAACIVFFGLLVWFKRKMKDYDLILEQKANGELELEELFTPLKYAKKSLYFPADPLNRNCDLRMIDHVK